MSTATQPAFDRMTARISPVNSASYSLLIALYLIGRVLQVYRGGVPIQVVVALHVIPPAIFAILHGNRLYGWYGSLLFPAICLGVAFAFEYIGVHAGIPFGRYYFTDVMGPKFSVVPVMLAGAYVGMAYLSWVLATIIAGARAARLVPLVAALAMLSWDLSLDPVWATIVRGWVWIDGGPYFGVPMTNFVGWFLTVFVIFELFALAGPAKPTAVAAGFWRQAVVFYGLSAAGNLLPLLPNSQPAVVTDPAGGQWRTIDITASSALVTLLTMGTYALFAWQRVQDISVSETPRSTA